MREPVSLVVGRMAAAASNDGTGDNGEGDASRRSDECHFPGADFDLGSSKKKLGEGAFGIVYLVTDIKRNRKVVMKIPREFDV